MRRRSSAISTNGEHARSGDRIAIAAHLGGSDVFDQAITRFAAAYAGQNERDHKSLVDAVASGRLTAGATVMDNVFGADDGNDQRPSNSVLSRQHPAQRAAFGACRA